MEQFAGSVYGQWVKPELDAKVCRHHWGAPHYAQQCCWTHFYSLV